MLRTNHIEHQLTRVPMPTPVNEQVAERDMDLAERGARLQATDDKERYFQKVVKRDMGLVAAGWTFDDIDAANCQRRPGLSSRQLRAAEKATTVRPIPLTPPANRSND